MNEFGLDIIRKLRDVVADDDIIFKTAQMTIGLPPLGGSTSKTF